MTLSLLDNTIRQRDTISIAQKADEKASIAVPSIFETKDIVEKSFIYGLLIVMNYAVMHVDKNSGQGQGNHLIRFIMTPMSSLIKTQLRVVTPNNDTLYSML